jgi:hypothetical protein
MSFNLYCRLPGVVKIKNSIRWKFSLGPFISFKSYRSDSAPVEERSPKARILPSWESKYLRMFHGTDMQAKAEMHK